MASAYITAHLNSVLNVCTECRLSIFIMNKSVAWPFHFRNSVAPHKFRVVDILRIDKIHQRMLNQRSGGSSGLSRPSIQWRLWPLVLDTSYHHTKGCSFDWTVQRQIYRLLISWAFNLHHFGDVKYLLPDRQPQNRPLLMSCPIVWIDSTSNWTHPNNRYNCLPDFGHFYQDNWSMFGSGYSSQLHFHSVCKCHWH